jgi:transcriptional regulator with XRE-family HTH domain
MTTARRKLHPFGARIRQLRKEHGLTQHQLAAFVGVSQSAVVNWETRPDEVPKGGNLLKVAEAFGINAVDLMGMTGKSSKESVLEVQLLAAFRVLTIERKSIAIKVLEALK